MLESQWTIPVVRILWQLFSSVEHPFCMEKQFEIYRRMHHGATANLLPTAGEALVPAGRAWSC
jgi:hypothetical protein